ncbi:uncharacterized protein PG998_005639 [Apiospora kogelbergensis]|uniref:uncharacterized protein n=1 Tax=Apiospora kogelbergensis TaxID=1337665 RepID=UPI00312F4D28
MADFATVPWARGPPSPPQDMRLAHDAHVVYPTPRAWPGRGDSPYYDPFFGVSTAARAPLAPLPVAMAAALVRLEVPSAPLWWKTPPALKLPDHVPFPFPSRSRRNECELAGFYPAELVLRHAVPGRPGLAYFSRAAFEQSSPVSR